MRTPDDRVRHLSRTYRFNDSTGTFQAAVAAQIKEAIDAEREACAKTAEKEAFLKCAWCEQIATVIAAAIRARGEDE